MTRTGVADGPRVVGDGAIRGKESKFFLCVARLPLMCTKHNGRGFHLFDCGLPFLVLFWKHHRGFIAYPPAPLSTRWFATGRQ